MKKFILIALTLLSFSSFAQDYTCYVSSFKLSFKADGQMSDLIIRDRVTGEFVYTGYVDSIQNFGNQIQYNFSKFKMTPLRKQVTLEYFSPCPPLRGNLVRSLCKPNLA